MPFGLYGQIMINFQLFKTNVSRSSDVSLKVILSVVKLIMVMFGLSNGY